MKWYVPYEMRTCTIHEFWLNDSQVAKEVYYTQQIKCNIGTDFWNLLNVLL